jgi:hypothetical protein
MFSYWQDFRLGALLFRPLPNRGLVVVTRVERRIRRFSPLGHLSHGHGQRLYSGIGGLGVGAIKAAGGFSLITRTSLVGWHPHPASEIRIDAAIKLSTKILIGGS